MLVQINQIVELLKEMTNDHLQQHNQKLEEICLNPAALHSFKTILANYFIDDQIKKMAAAFFKNYCSQRYSDFDEVFFVELVMGIILDEKIPYKYKIIIQETTIKMIEWVQKCTFRINQENLCQIIDCLQKVFLCLERASGKIFLPNQIRKIKNKGDMDYTRLDLSKLSQLNLASDEQILNISFSIVHFIECFTTVSCIDTQDLHRIVRISLTSSLTIFPLKNCEQYLRLQMVILHMWLGFIEKIEDEVAKRPDAQFIESEIFEEERLWYKIVQIYEFASFSLSNGSFEDQILACSHEEPEKKIIHKMKYYACLSNFYPIIIVHAKLLAYEISCFETPTFFNKTISFDMFTKILRTLSYFSTQKQSISIFFCEEFINSLLSLVILLSKEAPEILENNWQNLLHMIVFPLLVIDEKEQKNFEEDPEEFCRVAEDCCDKQYLGQIKTEAAKFLEVICDRNVVYCQYVIQYCCNSFEYEIKKEELNIINGTFLLPLETSFMILSILSYSLNRFSSEKSKIKQLLMKPECLKLSEIEASRIFLFLAYTYSQIFNDPLEGKMWINFAINSKMHYTTRITALDFIFNIVDDFFQEEFLIMFSNTIVEETEIRQIWDIINKLLNNHFFKVNEDVMICIMEKTLQRISQDIQKYNQRQIKSTINIANGLQLMRKVLSNRNYVKNKPKLLQEIFKVIPLYKTFKNLNLEDIILKIIFQFIAKDQFIADEFQEILPFFMEEFVQQGYRPSSFYWVWNEFIFKSTSLNQIKQITKLIIEGLNSLIVEYFTDKKKTKSNLPLSHGFLLLQNVFILHGDRFTLEQIKAICDLSVKMLPEDFRQPQKLNLNPVIIGRVLIVILLCSILQKSLNCSEQQRIKALHYLLKYYDEENVFRNYNGEVLVRLLCKQLFRQSDPVGVAQMITIMVMLLRPSSILSSNNLLKKPSKHSTKFKIKSIQNYDAILKKIKLPFNAETPAEYELVNSLNKMKENNQFLYKSLIATLPPDTKDKLRDIFTTNTSNTLSQGLKNRRILKIRGIKNQMIDQEQPNLGNQTKKRTINFNAQNQNELDQQVNSNELILQNDEENLKNPNQDKKNKIKKIKMKKKLKQSDIIEA